MEAARTISASRCLANWRAGKPRRDAPTTRFGLLTLNAEFYPASGTIPFLMGEAYLQKGDTATALASYRDALAKDSTNVPARRRIAALSGAAPH